MIAVIILLVLLAASLYLRLREKRRVETHEVPEHAKPSPFSEAVGELVTVAGGIYLSLILLVTFLQVNLPDHWLILGTQMDPLAFIALVMAIVQPVIIRVFNLAKGGGF